MRGDHELWVAMGYVSVGVGWIFPGSVYRYHDLCDIVRADTPFGASSEANLPQSRATSASVMDLV